MIKLDVCMKYDLFVFKQSNTCKYLTSVGLRERCLEDSLVDWQ
jgi:hypothetical protein